VTVIASDGVFVAADSLTTHSGGQRSLEPFQKIYKYKGHVLAFSGAVSPYKHLIAWLVENEADVEKLPKQLPAGWQMMHFTAECCWVYNDDLLYPDKHEYPCAFGTGAYYAIGALVAGAPLHKAITSAISLDTNCGGPIKKVKIT